MSPEHLRGPLATMSALGLLVISVSPLTGGGSAVADQSLTTAAAPVAKPSGPVASAPLIRYGCLWEGRLTRSGLPNGGEGRAGWLWLRERGVVSIVTLRRKNDIDYSRFGFKYLLRIPLEDTDTPTEQEVQEFLGFITNPAHWPVHIHCAQGKDRTGLMAALTRYAVDGWPLERALEEARLYSGKSLVKKHVAWLRDWAGKHEPGSYQVAPGRGK